MAGVTEYGFVRKTLQEILTSMKSNVKTKLGSGWNVETGTIEDQFISVFAEECDEVWQGLEGVVSSNTVTGAEGTYLDDVYARQGIYRQDKTKGGGNIVLQSNLSTMTLGSVYNAGAVVSATNSILYNTLETITLDNYASCYKISASQLTAGVTYTFSIYNSNNPTSSTFTRTPNNDADKSQLLTELATFLNDTITDKPAKAYYNTTTRTTYIGYNQANDLPNPFPNKRLYVNVSPSVGIIGHSVSIEAQVSGYHPLSPNGVLGISPTYTGYDSVVNYVELSSGSEVQTDAEFRLSALNIKDTSIAGTPDALKASLLKLEGVSSVEVFENPTKDFIYDISSKLVCEPYSYNTVVLGGTDVDVATTIYQKGYGNTKRYGTYSTTIINKLGQSVEVKYTRAGIFDVGVEVGYTTKDNSPLTEQEKNEISANLLNIVSGLDIGGYVVPKQLEAIMYQSVSFGRLLDVAVSLKDLTLPNPTFTSNKLLADHNEKPRLLSSNLTFRRI